MKLLPGAVAALVLSSAAHAAPRTLSVKIGGDEVRMPVPEGYCEPQGRYANIAQLTDAMDSQSITYLALVDCAAQAGGGDLQRYLFLRAPKAMMAERLTRPELLDRMGPVPDSSLNLALDNPGVERARQDAERAQGRKLEVSADIRPVAKDAHGFYVAGLMKTGSGGQTRETAIAIGATTAQRHVVAINSYVRGSDLAAVREALRVAREATRELAEANP